MTTTPEHDHSHARSACRPACPAYDGPRPAHTHADRWPDTRPVEGCAACVPPMTSTGPPLTEGVTLGTVWVYDDRGRALRRLDLGGMRLEAGSELAVSVQVRPVVPSAPIRVSLAEGLTLECPNGCAMTPPYGWVPAAGCPEHDVPAAVQS